MNRRQFLATQTGLIGGLGTLSLTSAGTSDKNRRESRLGVSLAGPEFGVGVIKSGEPFSNRNPGKFGEDYTHNSERTVAYFCAKNLQLLRIPLRWERLQPRLGQDLDKPELDHLTTVVGWARKHGGSVILDLHNYGRYVVVCDDRAVPCIIDHPDRGAVIVKREHFADLWRRLSQVFRNHSTVAAYGLMNEPHDMSSADWKAISQAAVNAIRGVGDQKRILVSGDGWSSAHTFAQVNGAAWIKDSAQNHAYEAHCYFDHRNEGIYDWSFDAELKADPNLENRGAERLGLFVNWCRKNGVSGFLGEFGAPGKDPRWLKVFARFLEALRDAGMDGCYWAAGEWWGNDHPLSIQPSTDFQRPAPQMSVLTK